MAPGGDNVARRKLPVCSEILLTIEFDFLIHAMLGLSASHLSLAVGRDYKAQALAHRIQSMRSLNEALNRPCTSLAEGDARFATVMALTFQSSYMDEGMLDFLSMIRGCIVVSNSAMPCFEESAFRSFSADEHDRVVKGLNGAPEDENEPGWDVDVGLASVRALGLLCRSTTEIKFLTIVESILRACKTSFADGMAPIHVSCLN